MPSWWVPVQYPTRVAIAPSRVTPGSVPAPITALPTQPPAFSFVPVTYTRRQAIIGATTGHGPSGPSALDQTLAQVKQAINYAVTATKLAVQVAVQAGSQAASNVASAIPIVGVAVAGANIGLSYGQNAKTRAAKEERDIGTATTALAAIPFVGLVTLAVSIPRLIEGLVDSANERKGLAKQRSDYVQAGITLNAKIPVAVKVSDRVDEFHMLPRVMDRVKLIQWVTDTHRLALFALGANAEDKASGYENIFTAMNQLENGNAILGVPGRDITTVRQVWSDTQQDAWIMFFSCRDILARLKQPILNESAADYDDTYLNRLNGAYTTWIRALAGWSNVSGVGIVPGATIPITPAGYGTIESTVGTQGGEVVPVVPSLASLSDQMRVPGNSLDLMVQYWESADPNAFHQSQLWQRISKVAIRETIAAIAAPIAVLSPAPHPEQIQAEIYSAKAVAIQAQRDILYAQHPEFLKPTDLPPMVATTGLIQTPSGFELGPAGGSTTPFVPGSVADGYYQAQLAEGADPAYAYAIAGSLSVAASNQSFP